ncbi:hypothetical protein JCM6882_009060 [Rhodosporidiobolus microsporus]
MDFLKAEIASKKRHLDSHSPSPAPDSADQPKKYLKRSELEQLRREEQEREQRIKDEERKAKLYGKKSAPSSTSRPSSSSTGTSPLPGSPAPGTPEPSTSSSAAAAAATAEEKYFVSNEDAVRRLRQKGQPIRLFGESDKDRRLRLRALELLEREQEGAGGGQGQRNEFQRALKGSERAMEVEEAVGRRGGAGGSKGGSAVPSRTGTPVGGAGGKGKERALEGEKEGTPASALSAGEETATDGADDSDATGPVAKRARIDPEGKKEPNPKDEEVIVDLSLVKSNPHKVYPQIYHAFKRVLKEWEASLAARPESVRRSTQGKLAAATQATSAEYLKPLFKQLRKRDLQSDVLSNVAEIAHHMQTREYLRANDAYLRLSIGNAPWPIGVTMVGIHERSGREKIFSNNVAHVLNDETSRKYIQSLKRLLTFAQAVRPPDDVSQKMG